MIKTVIYIRIDTEKRSIDGYYSFQVTYYDRLHHPKQTLSAFFGIMNNILCIIQFADLSLPPSLSLFFFLITPCGPLIKNMS